MSFRYSRLFVAFAVLAIILVVSGCGDKRSETATVKKETTAATNKAEKKRSAAKKPGEPTAPGATVPLPIAGGGIGSVTDTFLGGGKSLTAPSPAPAIPGVRPMQGRAAAPPPKIQPGKRPTAGQLLQIVQANYRSIKSLKLAKISSDTVTQDGKVVAQRKSEKSSFLFKRPNKFVVRTDDGATYSDGKTIYEYSSEAKRFVKGKMSDEVLSRMVMGKPGISVVGLLMGMDYTPHIKSSKLLPDSKVGNKDTYVLSLDLKAPQGATASSKLWIGKADYGIYKEEFSAKMTPKAPPGYKGKVPKLMQSTSTATFTEYVPNASIADSSFAFKPPAGVKQFDPSKDMKKPEPVSLLDKHAPDFSFKWTDGATKKLSDFRGRVVVLDFWALPMAEDHLPILHSTNKKAAEGVEIISICMNDDEKKIREYMQGKGFSFPLIMANQEIADAVMTNYQLVGVPTIYVIDKQGIVRRQIHGNVTEADLKAKIDKVLAM